MRKFCFLIIALALAALPFAAACSTADNADGEENGTAPAGPDEPSDPALVRGETGKGRFAPAVYPPDVTTLEARGMGEADFLSRADNNATYLGNKGYDTPSVFISPRYSLTINGVEVPVYCTLTYVGGAYGKGALHSFAAIDAAGVDFSFEIELTSLGAPVKSAVALPEKLGVEPVVSGERVVSAVIGSTGSYTFLTGGTADGAADQFNAFTLFVRTYADEEKEIAEYREKYGDGRVIVYGPGLHEISNINIENDGTVLYLRRGALLLPRHIPEYTENNRVSEPGAKEGTGFGVARWPAINANGKKDVKIAGRGTLDLGRLDWEERLGVTFTFCSDIEIKGLTVLNPPHWNITTYRCENVNIEDVIIFGYKTNSDGVGICNSRDVTVSRSFARSGDDLFQVKTLGGDETAVTKNVVFTDCYAWAGKARCFGLTYETNKNVSDVAFLDCAVLFCDSTWDNNLMGALVVVVGEGEGDVENIAFENIEIYRAEGRPILVTVNAPGSPGNTVKGVLFRNVVYNSAMPGLLYTRQTAESSVGVILDNVTANGVKITAENLSEHINVRGRSVAHVAE